MPFVQPTPVHGGEPLPPLDLPAYKVSEVAALLRVKVHTIYAGCADGSIPSARLSARAVRVPGSWVREQLGVES